MACFVFLVGLSHSLLCTGRHNPNENSTGKIRSLTFQMLGALGLLPLLTVSPLVAQTVPPDPDAGIQMWSTNDFGIDLATGTVNLQIPGRSKAGPIPFSSAFVGTSNAYEYSTTVNGQTTKGIEVDSLVYGPRYVDTRGLGITETVVTIVNACGDSQLFQNFAVIDLTGAVHPFPTTFVWPTKCQVPSPTVTTDGSGYTLVPLTTQQGATNATFAMYDSSGRVWPGICVAASACYIMESVSDPDGNSLSTVPNSSGGSNVQDGLSGTPVVTVNGVDGVESYTTASGSTAGYGNTYSGGNGYLSIRTNFACGLYTDLATSLPLTTSLTTPDGGQYQFAYEPTPNGNGFTNTNPPTYFTGRLAKITFPSGGSISYVYSGGHNGFSCSIPGWVPTITVTVNDNNGNNNTWTYINSVSQGNGVVTKTDPAGNQTIYNFWSELPRQVTIYQGGCPTSTTGCNGGGTLLQTTTTCYNNNFSSCASAYPSLPLSQTDVYTSYGTGSSNLVETKYDTTYSNVLEVKRYDFGAAMPPTGNPVSDTTITRAGVNGVACGTVAPYQYDRPCSITTKNSSGSIVSQVNYTYTNGHPTQTSTLATGSTYLTSTASYNANGTVATATDVNGNAHYTYAYNGTGGCNNLLPTSVTVTGSGLPAGGLTTSTQWDCNGGVSTSTKDPNNQVTSTNYVVSGVADPYYRPLSTADPLGNTTNYSYSPTTFESAMNFGTGSTTDTLLTTDGLGRQIFSQTRQGQGSSMFDTVQTTYGWSTTGPFTTTSTPYPGTQAEPAPSGTGVTTTQDDAVSRPLSVSNTGGGVVNNTYSQNDVLSILGPAPTGEHAKQTQTQYDGLGRATSFCGIESSGGTSCGQVTGSLSGVVTTTAYTSSAGSQTVTSTRASQSRSSVEDGSGRTTQVVTPEGGTWNYYYDSYSSCPTGYSGASGQLTAVKDPNGNLLCYSYDALNRVTGVNANGTTCRHFYYDNSLGYSGSIPSGVTTPAYPNGRMVEAATDACSSGTLITDEWFSYDKDGRLLNSWELTPNSTQYYKAGMTYTGPSLTAVNFLSPSLSAFTYDLDGEGRWNGMLVGSATDVAGVTYNAAGQPTKISIGSGTDYDGYAYDPNTMNMTGWTFQVNSAQETATITPNPNNTIKSVAITDGFNANGTITCSYNTGLVTGTGYDDLGRLIGHSCTGIGGTWSQSFAYDQYDNITKTGSGLPSWNPGYSATTNHYTCTGCTTGSNGNVTNDGTNAYTWNAFSKMASVNMSGSGCSTSGDCIVYDAFGRAVEFDNGSTKTEIWYSPIGKHYLNGTTPLYGYEAAPGGGTIFGSTYMHKDWIGNARVISSITASTITTDRAFAPYGEIFNIFGGTGQSDIMFAGLDQGIFAGMYDTPNRELQGSQQGRWLSPDPAGSGWNQYAYPTNPNSETDPLGLAPNCLINPITGTCFRGFTSGADPSAGCLNLDGGGACAGLIGSAFDWTDVLVRTWGCWGDCGYYVVGDAASILLGGGWFPSGAANNNPCSSSRVPIPPSLVGQQLRAQGYAVTALGVSPSGDITGISIGVASDHTFPGGLLLPAQDVLSLQNTGSGTITLSVTGPSPTGVQLPPGEAYGFSYDAAVSYLQYSNGQFMNVNGSLEMGSLGIPIPFGSQMIQNNLNGNSEAKQFFSRLASQLGNCH